MYLCDGLHCLCEIICNRHRLELNVIRSSKKTLRRRIWHVEEERRMGAVHVLVFTAYVSCLLLLFALQSTLLKYAIVSSAG